jgi:hypothetical protein
MNEVNNAMKSAHGRSFFLYSNGIVSPMKAMFVHEIDISGERCMKTKEIPSPEMNTLKETPYLDSI